MHGSTRKHNGDKGNPEKGLQNGMDRNGGGGKSMRTFVWRSVENQGKSEKESEKGRKDETKIRKFEEKFGHQSKWKGWPKEK